jgi:hypothetical protein
MLWTTVRWNAANTLPLAAFCLLSMLGAVNSGLTASSNNDARMAEARACKSCLLQSQQLLVVAARLR